MALTIAQDAYTAAALVADAVEALVRRKPRAVLGLACGRSSALVP